MRRLLWFVNLGLVLAAGAALNAGPADAVVYWADNTGAVGRAAPFTADTAIVEQRFIAAPSWAPLPTGIEPVGGVASDGRHVYRLRRDKGTIARANIDGSDVIDEFIQAPPSTAPGYIGLATAGGYLFERDINYSSTIWRAPLDGSAPGIPVVTTPAELIMTGFTADDAHLYASFWNRQDPAVIHRYNLDGSGDTVIVSGVRSNELAASGGYLFWTVGPDSFIGRARTDGTDLQPRFLDLGDASRRAMHLAADGAHIYWHLSGSWTEIARAELDGSHVIEQWATTAGAIQWIATDDLAALPTKPAAVESPAPGLPGAPVQPARPAISGLTVARALVATWWRPTSVSPERRRLVGATLSYRLSAAATVRFEVSRPRGARAAALGQFTAHGQRGMNRLWFSGRVAGHALGLGTYRLTATVPGSPLTATATFAVVPLR